MTGDPHPGAGGHRDAAFLKARDPLPHLIGRDLPGRQVLDGSSPLVIEALAMRSAPAIRVDPVSRQRTARGIADDARKQQAVFEHRNSDSSHGFECAADIVEFSLPSGAVQEQVGGIQLGQIQCSPAQPELLDAPLDVARDVGVKVAFLGVTWDMRHPDPHVVDPDLLHEPEPRFG